MSASGKKILDKIDLSLVRFSNEKLDDFFDASVDDTGFKAEYKNLNMSSQNLMLDPIANTTSVTETLSSDTGFKIQYKEYTFETSPNKEIEQKVAAFWRSLGDMKPPETDIFKSEDIKDCFDATKEPLLTEENSSLSEEETDISEEASEKWKWTNTFCLFKKRHLDKAAKAAVPQCSLCENEDFAPVYADEVPMDIKICGNSNSVPSLKK